MQPLLAHLLLCTILFRRHIYVAPLPAATKRLSPGQQRPRFRFNVVLQGGLHAAQAAAPDRLQVAARPPQLQGDFTKLYLS